MSEQSIPPRLEEYRKQIDALDQEIVDVLVRRFDVVRKVGELKIDSKLEAIQPARAQAVKDAAVRMGQDKGLDPDFMRRIYEVLIDYAHDLEHEILADADKD